MFKYNNGIEVPLPTIDLKNKNNTKEISVIFPSVSGNPNSYDTYKRVAVTNADFVEIDKARYGSKPAENKIYVGVLTEDTKHPFLKGTYIPFKTERYGSSKVAFDGLVAGQACLMHPDFAAK